MWVLFCLVFPCFVSPLLGHCYFSHPDFLAYFQCADQAKSFSLTSCRAFLGSFESNRLEMYWASFQPCGSPIHIGVENEQKRVPQNEVIFSQPSKKEMHLHNPALISDFEYTIVLDLALLILGAVHIVHSEQLAQFDLPNIQLLPDGFIYEVLSCPAIQQGNILSHLMHIAKFER